MENSHDFGMLNKFDFLFYIFNKFTQNNKKMDFREYLTVIHNELRIVTTNSFINYLETRKEV
jgi:hypothetical protein